MGYASPLSWAVQTRENLQGDSPPSGSQVNLLYDDLVPKTGNLGHTIVHWQLVEVRGARQKADATILFSGRTWSAGSVSWLFCSRNHPLPSSGDAREGRLTAFSSWRPQHNF
jgi:hypothetical protein